jgi:palmitoyltransferase
MYLLKYYGPSILQLAHLFILLFANSMVLFMLSILLVRVIWMLALNQTTIEGWEIERHKTLVRRARLYGGFLDGPNGIRIRMQRQEFPYDIGIWQNIKDGMGDTNNVGSERRPNVRVV